MNRSSLDEPGELLLLGGKLHYVDILALFNYIACTLNNQIHLCIAKGLHIHNVYTKQEWTKPLGTRLAS